MKLLVSLISIYFTFFILHSGLLQAEALEKNIPLRMVGYSQVGSWTRDGWDYKRFLDMLSEYRLNYTRIFGIVPWFGGLMPWFREADDRYDLKRFNEKYWERLIDYVKYANNKGIVVHFSLFDRCGMTDSDGWQRHPFNQVNNINNIEAERGRHTFVSEQFREVQRNYIIRVVKELKEFNILFEVANEPYDGLDWHKWVIEVLKGEGLKDGIISVNIFSSEIERYDLSARWASFHFKESPRSINKGMFIYSDDGLELRDPDIIYRWAKDVLDRGSSYEHLSAADDNKGSMPPVEVLTVLMKARYERDRE